MKGSKDPDLQNQLPGSEKTLFEVAREYKEKQLEIQAENERLIKKQQENQREEYTKKLHQERIDLMRRKQGLVSDEVQDISAENIDTPKKYTLRERVSNFLYHSKWWLGLAVFGVAIVSYLIYDIVTRVTPDMTVMILSYGNFNAYTQDIAELFEECAEDANGDGKVYVQVLYLPCSEEFDAVASMDYNMSVVTKMNAEFQSGSTAIIISDDAADKKCAVDEIIDDLSDFDIATNNGKFYLKNSKFSDKINYEGELSDDVYIGIRAPYKGAHYEDTLLETIEVSKPALYNFLKLIEE